MTVSSRSTTPRVPSGVPTGGQFAASERAESSVDLGGVQARVATLEQDLDAQRALAHRLEAYQALAEFGDDDVVTTIEWPEEASDDGVFDVDLARVLDANGDEVENLMGQGAVPAGWIDSGARRGYRTAFDAWREDSEDPQSPISIRNMRAWRASLDQTQAAEADQQPQAPTHPVGAAAARPYLSPNVIGVFEAEIANERHGGTSPATVASCIDSLHQGLLHDAEPQAQADVYFNLMLIRDRVSGDTELRDILDEI